MKRFVSILHVNSPFQNLPVFQLMPVNNIQVNFKSKHSYRISLCVCCISVTNEDLSQPESCEFTGCRGGLEGTATHF